MIHPDVIAHANRVGVDLTTQLFPNSYGSPDVTLEMVVARRSVSDGHPDVTTAAWPASLPGAA